MPGEPAKGTVRMDINPRDRRMLLTLRNRRSEIVRASEWLDGCMARAGVPAALSGRLQVVLDEVLSNVLGHALAGVPEGEREIFVCFRRRPKSLELEVTDDGPAFDPTGAAAKRVAARTAARGYGGFGLLFVRELMDEMVFTRRGGRNRLILRKHFDTPAKQAEDM